MTTVKTTRQRAGWERVRGGCGGVWRHPASGWLVKHCGHPTALWPYYGVEPGTGRMLTYGGFGFGYAFRTLADCQASVERHLLSPEKTPVASAVHYDQQSK